MRTSSTKLTVTIAGLMLMGLSLPVVAVDSMSIEAGVGSHVEMVRVGAQWDWNKQWFQSNGSHIGGYWDLSLSQWRGSRYLGTPGRHQNITSIGLTPVLRWQKDSKKGLYAEVGIGANLLSGLYNNDGDRLSTRFQFGDHIGVGYVFDNKWDIGVKLQHYSNANIKHPNDGVDFIGVRARYVY